jgi:hypothetical protein
MSLTGVRTSQVNALARDSGRYLPRLSQRNAMAAGRARRALLDTSYIHRDLNRTKSTWNGRNTQSFELRRARVPRVDEHEGAVLQP